MRVLVAVVFLAGIILTIGDMFTPQPSVSRVSFSLLNGNVGTASVVSLAGLSVTGDVRIGDVLRIVTPSPHRVWAAMLPFPTRATFINSRTGLAVALEDRPQIRTIRWLRPYLILRLSGELVGLALLVVRGRRREVLALSAFLYLNMFPFMSTSGAWLGSWGLSIYGFIQMPALVGSFVALIAFAGCYAVRDAIGRVALRIGYALSVVALVFAFAENVPVPMPTQLLNALSTQHLNGILFLAALALFGIAWHASAGTERRRLTILGGSVVVGSTTSLYSLIYGTMSYTDAEVTLTIVTWIVMVLGLVYAVFVEDIFDIAFAVNRTLVYGVLTATLAGGIGLADWFVKSQISEVRLANTVNAAIVLILAIAVSQFRTSAQKVVERVLFASRYEAERELKRAGTALALAHERATIDCVLVNDARIWLQLSSVAVFLPEGREFVRIAAHGWDDASLSTLGVEDYLIRALTAEREALSVRSLPGSLEKMPTGRLRPTYIVPLFFRLQLLGVVFTGPHLNGTHLDPQERLILERLCAEAATAYAAIEMQLPTLALSAGVSDV